MTNVTYVYQILTITWNWAYTVTTNSLHLLTQQIYQKTSHSCGGFVSSRPAGSQRVAGVTVVWLVVRHAANEFTEGANKEKCPTGRRSSQPVEFIRLLLNWECCQWTGRAAEQQPSAVFSPLLTAAFISLITHYRIWAAHNMSGWASTFHQPLF